MGEQQQGPTSGRGAATARRGRWRLSVPVGIGAVALVVGLLAGYVVGHGRPAMHEADVACRSAARAISCGPVGSPGTSEYAVPLDVAWSQDATFHDGGRPACLPPTGRGAVRVSVTWTAVETAGTGWKQVVGVHC